MRRMGGRCCRLDWMRMGGDEIFQFGVLVFDGS
jgi:hypothetical protein